MKIDALISKKNGHTRINKTLESRILDYSATQFRISRVTVYEGLYLLYSHNTYTYLMHMRHMPFCISEYLQYVRDLLFWGRFHKLNTIKLFKQDIPRAPLEYFD